MHIKSCTNAVWTAFVHVIVCMVGVCVCVGRVWGGGVCVWGVCVWGCVCVGGGEMHATGSYVIGDK